MDPYLIMSVVLALVPAVVVARSASTNCRAALAFAGTLPFAMMVIYLAIIAALLGASYFGFIDAA